MTLQGIGCVVLFYSISCLHPSWSLASVYHALTLAATASKSIVLLAKQEGCHDICSFLIRIHLCVQPDTNDGLSSMVLVRMKCQAGRLRQWAVMIQVNFVDMDI